jgi:rhomboid family GlyGly-CTERM serine protease
MKPRYARWLGLAALIGATLGAQTLLGVEALRYDRAAIADGELWRPLSAHLVHLGPTHWALNAVGLVLVNALVGAHLRLPSWALAFAVSALAISGGLWLALPQLNWYVGLSGVLHGLIVAGSLHALADPRERIFALVVVAVIVAKLIWEQAAGPLPGTTRAAGGPVVVEAHLFGGLGGALAAAGVWARQRLRLRSGSAPEA